VFFLLLALIVSLRLRGLVFLHVEISEMGAAG
jgi:hypothetical protein